MLNIKIDLIDNKNYAIRGIRAFFKFIKKANEVILELANYEKTLNIPN